MRYVLEDDSPVPKASKPRYVLEEVPDPTGSFGENMAAGVGKAVVDAGRGAKQILDVPAKWLERKFGTLGGEKLGLPTAHESASKTQAEVDESRVLDAPLMKTAGGLTGNIGGNVLMAAAVPGATTLKGAAAAGGALGAVQPTAQDESRLLNTAIGTAAGAGGKVIGDKVAGAVANRLSRKTAEVAANKAQNASKDATLNAAREAGYVVPPTQANAGSAWNQLLEGFSGKIKTGQAASAKNQEVTNRLAREALELPDGPITREALKAVRDRAGQSYADLSNVGRYATDSTFRTRLGALSDAQATMAREVPELADKEVLSLVQSLNKPEFDGQTVVALTKMLREKATEAFRSGRNESARFYRGAASEVEDLIERNLMQSGQENLLTAFRQGRATIAKAHTVEAALNDATGSVSGAKLAAQLKRGKPLSGGLRTAGEFAEAFPKAAQEVEKSGALSTSPLDWATMGSIGALLGEPTMLAGVAARPAARSLILSKPYQNAMAQPTYRVSNLLKLGEGAVNNSVVRRATPGGATVGALYLNK